MIAHLCIMLYQPEADCGHHPLFHPFIHNLEFVHLVQAGAAAQGSAVFKSQRLKWNHIFALQGALKSLHLTKKTDSLP